jgi:hypothetical protein
MKLVRLASLALLLVMAGAACKKDAEPAFVIEGKWEGKLGTGNATPASFVGLKIKPNGVLERFSGNGEVAATGTWQLKGTAFTGMYTFTSGTVVNIKATVDKSKYIFTGTWNNSASETGTWYANKTN